MKVIRISAVWCPSCLVMKSRFDAVEEKYPDIEFKTYDIDFDEEVASFDVGNILPAFILLDDSNIEIDRLIGEKKTEEIMQMIEKHYIKE